MNGLNGAIDLEQVAQQKQQVEGYVKELNLNVAMHIYARLVGDYLQANPDAPPDNAVFNNLAFKARILSPYLAAQHGMMQYSLEVTPTKKS